MFENAKTSIEENIVPGKKEGTSATGLKDTLLSVLDDTREAIADLEFGVLGSITPTQELTVLNALPDGVYEAQTLGAYKNGLTAKDGYYTRFRKTGTTWKLESETKVPAYDDTTLKTRMTAVETKMDNFSVEVDQEFDENSENAISNKEVTKLAKVLDYFISADGERQSINTSTGWENKIYNLQTGYVANSFNNSLKINVVGWDKLDFNGRIWQTNTPSELSIVGTMVGVDYDNQAHIIIPGVVYNEGLRPLEYRNNVDISNIVELYIVKGKIDSNLPIITLKKGNPIEEDSVKKYIDSKVGNSVIFNVKDYGAKGDGVTDDRVAIQNTINACFLAGGGKVLFPKTNSYYNLGVNLATRNDVVGGGNMPKSSLVIPLNNDTTNLITIELVGEYKVNMADEAISNAGRSSEGFIKSEYVSNENNDVSIIASTFGGNYVGGKNYIHVHIENLVFRNETLQNNINVENKMHGVNMYMVTQFTFNYLKVETSSDLYNSVLPTKSIGIIMPSVNNKAQIGEGNCYVSGYYSGVMLGEHYSSPRTIVLGCVNGIEFPDTALSYHSCSITHLNAECCVNIIKMSNSNQVLNIFNYDVEHHNMELKWYNYQYDIKKTGGTGVVNIFNAQVTKSNVGNVNEFLTSGSPTYKVFTGVGVN